MKLNIIISAILIPLLFSCEESNSLETIDELSVEAFLHPCKSIDSVKFSRVIPLDSTLVVIPPENLNPFIVLEDGASVPLTYSGNDGVYQNLDFIIENNAAYKLEVSYKNKLITADTYTPTAAKSAFLSDTLVYRKKISEITDLLDQGMPDPIEVNWNGETGAYYFVHVRSIEDNPEVINTLFEDGNRPPLPDILTEPTTDPFFVINSFLDITYFGWYEVIIYTVNPEYVALYESNSNGSGSLNEIRTNVQNGFGIFTGINSTKLFFQVKKE